MKKISFYDPVQEGIQEVEKLMLAQADGYHPDIRAALELLLSSGGKRIRTALTLLTGKMLGANTDRLRLMAAAIELLHTATLVHDDLIDGSLLRRGNPTLNSKWSPGATVLTGDFMFARAANLAAQTDSNEVMRLFAQTLAIIVNGEITQLFASRCQANRDDYYARIYAKTASLFETSTASAAMISQAEPRIVDDLRQYGYEIGMAFQIVDDILDFTGDQATLGKPIGSDLVQGIVTLPALYYIEQHPNDPNVRALIDHEHCEEDHQRVVQLVSSIRSSDAIQQAHEEACQHIERSVEIIKSFPDNSARASLEQLSQYITHRLV